MASGPSAEDLVKESVGFPAIPSTPTKPEGKSVSPSAQPSSTTELKPSVTAQDKSVAAMVDKMIADNKVRIYAVSLYVKRILRNFFIRKSQLETST